MFLSVNPKSPGNAELRKVPSVKTIATTAAICLAVLWIANNVSAVGSLVGQK